MFEESIGKNDGSITPAASAILELKTLHPVMWNSLKDAVDQPIAADLNSDLLTYIKRKFPDIKGAELNLLSHDIKISAFVDHIISMGKMSAGKMHSAVLFSEYMKKDKSELWLKLIDLERCNLELDDEIYPKIIEAIVAFDASIDVMGATQLLLQTRLIARVEAMHYISVIGSP